MAYSEAMLRAIKKYEAEKIDRISLRVPKGKKEVIQKFAEDHGESVNSFINRAIDEAMAEEEIQMKRALYLNYTHEF